MSQLAMMNFQPSADDFCHDMGTSLLEVAMGDEGAIARIALVSGSDPATLLNASFKRGADHGALLFRGQKLIGQVRVGHQARFCPACLLQDIATANGMGHPRHHAYGRPQWHVSQIRTCVHHGIELAAIQTIHGSAQFDFAGNLAPCIDDLDNLATAARRRQPNVLETYLDDRLMGTKAGTGFLDGLGFSVSARFCEVLGAVAMFGPRPLKSGVADDQWHLGGAAGYGIASGGPETILPFLSGLRIEGNRDSRDGPHNDWGILYDWLRENRDPDLGPLQALARDHIVKTYPIGAGHLLFGNKVAERVTHSVTSASVEYGVHFDVLRDQLGAAGVIDNDPGRFENHILFPAQPNRILLERLGRGISALHAQRQLNCERQVFAPLVDAGVLKPIVAGTTGYPLFDPLEIDRLLEGLSAGAEAYAAKPDHLETITTTRIKVTCSHAEIVNLILAGKLSTLGRLETERGYAAVLVDPVEVAGYTRGEDLGGIVPEHIAADLGIPYAALAKMLEVHLPTVSLMHPHRRCLQRVVDREVYARFKARYVSLRDLAKKTGTNPKRYLAGLRRQGIDPEPEFPRGAYLYLRHRVE